MNEAPPLSDETLALRLRALGHPARLAILRALARAERCHCGEIVRGLPLAQSTVSQHLKILKEAGLICGTVEGPRSCYGLDRAVLEGTLAGLGQLLSGAASLPAANLSPGAALQMLAVEPLAFGGPNPISNAPTERDAPGASSEKTGSNDVRS